MPIRSKLVLVLGAGANVPYSFPTGRALVLDIVKNLPAGAPYFDDVMEALLEDGDAPAVYKRQIASFVNDLAIANPPSIDVFLEARQVYRQLGKLVIARALIPLESDATLRCTEPGGQWYHYLFERLFTPQYSDLSCNQLTVITFNFDRSFERAWFLWLKSRYDNIDDAAAAAGVNKPWVRILHVHGRLCAPAWLTGGVGGRHYDPASSPGLLRMAAQEIKLVQDEIEPAVLRDVKDAIRAADAVCFLGCGYHPVNLVQLAVDSISRPMHGTAYEIPAGELGVIKRNFKMLETHDRQWDVLTFLRETHFIHGG